MQLKLYYSYVELPKKVRLISKALFLDHMFEPENNSYFDTDHCCEVCDSIIGVRDLFELSKTFLFDEIYIFVTEENEMYYRDKNNEKVFINGWIEISQFSDSGHFTNDKLNIKSKCNKH